MEGKGNGLRRTRVPTIARDEDKSDTLYDSLHWGRSACHKASTHRTTQRLKMQIYIHALSGIETCDLNVQTVQNSTCHASIENDMVFKCLEKNNYQNEKCVAYFENYKCCKNFWARIRADRRQQGKVPHLPPPEEREKIRAAYVGSKTHQKS
ncbi:uncharacterized protein LOC111872110 [Cryptotermes secundus]|uniref:uncharacterized protein LOC111872110 n=1 Tax=Cryptotermes secundus TaxID=105785 RepID=UPI000CD7AE0D|nr:uncharacterized protein LOC111872110 [Cryptotermes secundus]